MRKEKQYRLYKAVKYEVMNFFVDHGMTLTEMWKVVNNKVGDIDLSAFWKNECMEDYFMATSNK